MPTEEALDKQHGLRRLRFLYVLPHLEIRQQIAQ